MVLSLTFVQVIHIPVTAHTRYWVLHSYVLNQLSSYINMYIQTTLINFTIDLCKLHRLDLQKSFMRCTQSKEEEHSKNHSSSLNFHKTQLCTMPLCQNNLISLQTKPLDIRSQHSSPLWLRIQRITAPPRTMARQLATLILKSKSCLYSQWYSGSDKNVTGMLSHDFHMLPNILSHLLSQTRYRLV